jgi:hypothetical protein
VVFLYASIWFLTSHGSYTNDTSQLYVQHHQHVSLPSNVPNHQPISQHVHQPCTNTYTIPSINHIPQLVCINLVPSTCIISCIKHVPCIIPSANHFPTMHQPCKSTMYINTIPCTNHMPYHVIHYILINQDMNQKCISPIRPKPTCTIHPMMCFKSYTKAHKHMLLACSSLSPRCKLIRRDSLRCIYTNSR